MTLETPRLDDRTFDDLVQEAMSRIPLYCPEWTDFNLSDPGITLIELFAWMTDIVLYRLNRVPDKHFVKFMELIGMRLRDAEPARVPVTFYLSAPQQVPVPIPVGTVISTTRTETEPAIQFTTDMSVEIAVPKIRHLMTRATDSRDFVYHNVSRMENGVEMAIPIFASVPPAPDDALYIGFEEDLSHHLIGIEVEVKQRAGAGIVEENPPWVWEIFGAKDVSDESDEHGWIACELDITLDERGRDKKLDLTGGFNRDGVVMLHLPVMQRATRGGHTAYWLRCRNLPGQDGNRYSKSPEIRRLQIHSWGVSVLATNATVATGEVIGRSDGTPGQRFYLEHTPVVPRLPGEQLVVRYQDGNIEHEDIWREVSDFASSSPEDRHYTLDSMTGEIRLAPALPQPDGTVRYYGAIPPKNAILVMRAYRHGGGRGGNVAARAINVVKGANAYIARVSNRRPARGGRDAEHLDDAKLRVPGHLRSLERAVTAEDYEYLAKKATRNVERAFCMPLVQPGEVRILVIPNVPNQQGFIAPESLRLTPEALEKITAFLDERRMIGTRLEVREPAYVWVTTEVRIRRSRGAEPEAVQKAIQSRLFGFLNPLTGGKEGKGWTFGRSLLVSDVVAELLTVPGVDSVRGVKIFEVRDNGEVLREAEEILVPADGVIASYNHLMIDEEVRRSSAGVSR